MGGVSSCFGFDLIGNLLTAAMFLLSKNGQLCPSLLPCLENSLVTTRRFHLRVFGRAVYV
jgi:hypothetical protein